MGLRGLVGVVSSIGMIPGLVLVSSMTDFCPLSASTAENSLYLKSLFLSSRFLKISNSIRMARSPFRIRWTILYCSSLTSTCFFSGPFTAPVSACPSSLAFSAAPSSVKFFLVNYLMAVSVLLLSLKSEKTANIEPKSKINTGIIVLK